MNCLPIKFSECLPILHGWYTLCNIVKSKRKPQNVGKKEEGRNI